MIKICGVTTLDVVHAAAGAGASHIGLVFVAASPRAVGVADAAGLAAVAAARGLVRVGLFVDADDGAIDVAAPFLDVAQLHGSETPARAAGLRARHGKPVWKALGVRARADIDAAARWAGAVDLVLFDAKPPAGAALPGGNGARFDWGLLSGWRAPLAWGLSGGLDPGNVALAVATARPPLVDVSSGVESAPGHKSPALIAAFCAAARSA